MRKKPVRKQRPDDIIITCMDCNGAGKVPNLIARRRGSLINCLRCKGAGRVKL